MPQGRDWIAELMAMSARYIAVFLLCFAVCCAGSAQTPQPPIVAAVTVNPAAAGRTIPQDFAGLSIDHNEASRWMGPKFNQLLNNLIDASGGPLFLRIEGDGAMTPNDTDYGGPYYNNCQHSGNSLHYPQSGPGYSLMGPLTTLLQQVNVEVSLGIDLACNQPVWATAEAKGYYDGLGPTLWKKVVAIEIGNEPDNYQYQNFRPKGYAFQANAQSPGYLADWQQWAGLIRAAIPQSTVKFMDPATAGSAYDAGVLSTIGKSFPVSIVSQHNYPIPKQPLCQAGESTKCNAPDLLLRPESVYGSHVGPELYHTYVDAVHKAAPGVLFRMGEFNDTGGGGSPGLSDSFESALWLLDIEFLYASLGYDGTNIHTGQYTTYNLWQLKGDGRIQFVKPKYYGLLAFEMAAGHGAKILPAQIQTSANVTAWATLSADNHVHVVIINKDENSGGAVTLSVPGYTAGIGTLLAAPTFNAKCKTGGTDFGCSSGVTLGMSTFDDTVDGKPVSWATNHPGTTCPLSPSSLCVQAVTGRGIFTVTVPTTSAIILDLHR